jgi:predicted flap endonuclease-1-like 5' DNA nuclease
MSAFLADYGIWLLIALLIVIAIMYLVMSRKPTGMPKPEPRIMAEEPSSSFVPETPAAPPPPELFTPEPPAPEPVKLAEAPPIEPTPPPPAAAADPAPATPTKAKADDLLQLKGVGPKLNTLLIEIGVTSFAQIAAWTDQDLATIDARLGTFKGRPVRDHWIDQAKYLAAGDIAGFEAKYGKL